MFQGFSQFSLVTPGYASPNPNPCVTLSYNTIQSSLTDSTKKGSIYVYELSSYNFYGDGSMVTTTKQKMKQAFALPLCT